MPRKKQWEILVSMLKSAPNHSLTIREIHVEGFINNVPDAAMQARKHGINITTEYLHDNPKVASYVLHEESKPLFRWHKNGDCGGVCKDCAPPGLEKTYGVGKTRSFFG